MWKRKICAAGQRFIVEHFAAKETPDEAMNYVVLMVFLVSGSER